MDLVRPIDPQAPLVDDVAAQQAARRSLRAQIAKLERDLAGAFVTAFPHGLPDGVVPVADGGPVSHGPRLLGLGELEEMRDRLAERLHQAREAIAKRADEEEANRIALEQMLLEPAAHPFEVMPLRALGEPGCGVYQVRPRMGLIGMLRGWWQVKLSSGCPLAGGRGAAPRPGPVSLRQAQTAS